MLLCLSHKATLRYLDIIGKEYNTEVHKWQENLEQYIIFQVYCVQSILHKDIMIVVV